jgi:hypothetical protein
MLTEITNGALEYICMNLREIDRVEIFAIRPHESPLQLAYEAAYQIRNAGRGRIAWHNGRPAGVFAFCEMWPGMWEVWMFGTDDFSKCAVNLLRWCRKEANEILTVCNGRRLQCDVREGHPEAHKLILALGAIPEGPMMRCYGKDGSSYQRYVWFNGVNDGVLKPHFTRAA